MLLAGLFRPLVVMTGSAPNGAREPGNLSGFLLSHFTGLLSGFLTAVSKTFQQFLLSTY